jgi:hypothetical protein
MARHMLKCGTPSSCATAAAASAYCPARATDRAPSGQRLLVSSTGGGVRRRTLGMPAERSLATMARRLAEYSSMGTDR